jgi:hypothetical protein
MTSPGVVFFRKTLLMRVAVEPRHLPLREFVAAVVISIQRRAGSSIPSAPPSRPYNPNGWPSPSGVAIRVLPDAADELES